MSFGTLPGLQEESCNYSNYRKNHQSDVGKEGERIPGADFVNHGPNTCRPAPSMCHLEHGVESLQETAVQVVHLQAGVQVIRLIQNVALKCLAPERTYYTQKPPKKALSRVDDGDYTL